MTPTLPPPPPQTTPYLSEWAGGTRFSGTNRRMVEDVAVGSLSIRYLFVAVPVALKTTLLGRLSFSCRLPITLRPSPLACAHTHRLAVRDPFLSWIAAILTTLLGVIRLRMVLSQAKCGSANVGYIADYNHRASGY